MRFTTTEETRNPYSHFVSRRLDASCVIAEEIIKVSSKLSCDYVFFQLLDLNVIIALSYLNYAGDLSVYFAEEHILNFHAGILSLFAYYRERSVVIVILYLTENIQRVSCVSARIKHYDRTVVHNLVKVVEYLV